MSKKPHSVVAFRCDASLDIGSGHVMRCLTLARMLRDKCYEVVFLSTEETLDTVSALRSSGFPVHHEDVFTHTDWLIVDHYGLDAAYESEARNWADKIMVIDDLADRKHNCDLLLDQTYGRKGSDYKTLVPETCTILTGVKYALLREEFSVLRQQINRDFSKAERLLVSFGGINPKESTEYALEMLEKFEEKPLHIDVVTGAGARTPEAVKRAVSRIESSGFHRITLHIDIFDIANLMAQADLCIGAGGTTSWERCCLKLPTMTLELADNQKLVLKNLNKAGAIYNMGPIESLDEMDFLKEFSQLMISTDRRQNMSEKASVLCSGDGTDRTLCYILPKQKIKSEKSVTLRYAVDADCKVMFEWQTHSETRRHARNPEPPTWKGHQDWFAKALNNPNRKVFIVECDGKPMGVVRLDKQDEKDTYEVSIVINPDSQGQGTGAAALALLRSYEPNAILIAEVLPDNTASHIIFVRAGYALVDESWYISNPRPIEKENHHV